MEKQSDNCPEWAEDLILKLRQVEIYLGNIPEAKAWKSEHLEKVAKRTFSDGEVFSEGSAELIYNRIVRGLFEESYSSEQISGFLNSRIGYEGGPPYTSEDEVNAARK